MTQQRVRDFDAGVAMIVTDLHGEGKVYQHIKETFFSLKEQGRVERLILCGDLIHGYGSESDDASLAMLLDIMRLQSELGEDVITMLLGNHEFPHIYSITLSKGELEFTPRFERALSKLDKSRDGFSRDDVMVFLRSLPFYVRTKAGVLVTHAGASPAVKSDERASYVLDFSHEKLLDLGDELLQNYSIYALRASETYRQQCQYYLSISDLDDPRFTDFLRGTLLSQSSADFQLLWDVLFATNEMGQSTAVYDKVADEFLSAISAVSPYEQHLIVAGHISAKNGAAVVGSRHLRLASYAHAQPQHRGKYLLLDCAKPVNSVDELMNCVYPTLA